MYRGVSTGELRKNGGISPTPVRGGRFHRSMSVSGCELENLVEPGQQATGLVVGAGQQATGSAVCGDSQSGNWGSRGTFPLAALYIHFGEYEAPK